MIHSFFPIFGLFVNLKNSQVVLLIRALLLFFFGGGVVGLVALAGPWLMFELSFELNSSHKKMVQRQFSQLSWATLRFS